MPPPPPALIVWRLLDGKPGHEKQTLGLANALARLAPSQCHDIAVRGHVDSLGGWLSRRFPGGLGLPDPDLILAAGHATHLPALAARRARGGRCVVLMKPSLPLGWFDLCLIPEHDSPPLRANVIATRGVLNPVAVSYEHRRDRGLFLIGGESAHYRWDDRAVVSAVEEVVRASPDVSWSLTTSRRTPPGFLAWLERNPLPANLDVLPAEGAPPGWVEQALAIAGQTWVTEDSVSMVYEALTSGSRVGILRLPPGPRSRVRRGVEKLIAAGVVATAAGPTEANAARLEAPPFNEAERCARLILARWPKNAN